MLAMPENNVVGAYLYSDECSSFLSGDTLYVMQPEWRDEIGEYLEVVSGPHSDMSACNPVYLVKLLNPIKEPDYCYKPNWTMLQVFHLHVQHVGTVN
jgi:hypothetical protein